MSEQNLEQFGYRQELKRWRPRSSPRRRAVSAAAARRARRSRDYLRHLVVPLCGLVILGFVVFKARDEAQIVGLIWLGIGLVVMIGLVAAGRTPTLAEPTEPPTEPTAPAKEGV